MAVIVAAAALDTVVAAEEDKRVGQLICELRSAVPRNGTLLHQKSTCMTVQVLLKYIFITIKPSRLQLC